MSIFKNQLNEPMPVLKGCNNASCFCTGRCKQVIGHYVNGTFIPVDDIPDDLMPLDEEQWLLWNKSKEEIGDVNVKWDKWITKLRKEQKYYPLFNGVELDPAALVQLFNQGKTPIDALNDLSTAS